MLGQYEADKFARSSHGPRDSMLRSWVWHLSYWFGEAVVPVPVEVSHLQAMGALFKSQSYRSFASYVSRVKDLHERAGYLWSRQHELEVLQGTRSVTRGQGPARQSAPLVVSDVMLLNPDAFDGIEQGPIGFQKVFLVGCAFLLREAELAFARRGHITFTSDAATLELPVSKTDPTAIGCSGS